MFLLPSSKDTDLLLVPDSSPNSSSSASPSFRTDSDASLSLPRTPVSQSVQRTYGTFDDAPEIVVVRTAHPGLVKWSRRFATVMEIIFLHAAMITGTAIFYSSSAIWISMLKDPRSSDLTTYNIASAVTFILALFIGLKEWPSYVDYLYEALNMSETHFEENFRKNYPLTAKAVDQSYGPITTTLNSMYFGGLAGSFAVLGKLSNIMTQMITATGAVAYGAAWHGVLSHLKVDNSNFNHLKTLLLSTLLGLQDVSVYVFGTIVRFQNSPDESNNSQIQTMYAAVGLFCCLALYYQTRMRYEEYVNEAQKTNPGVSSWFKNADRMLDKCIACTHPKARYLLEKLRFLLSNLSMTTVAAGEAYMIWSSWRSAAAGLGFIKDDDATVYPSNVFDVLILLWSFLGNFAIRFAELHIVINKRSALPGPSLPTHAAQLSLPAARIA